MTAILKNITLTFIIGLLTISSASACIPDNMIKRFKIYNNGSPIGEHTLKFSQEGDRTNVDIDIQMKAGVLFFTVFRYSHQNTEIWEGDQLISVDAKTDDNGDQFFVKVERTDKGLKVESKDHSYVTDFDTMSSTYWKEEMAKQSQLINTQTGELADLRLIEATEETYTVNGEDIPANRYRIKGDLDATLWYAKNNGEWIGLEFTVKGNTLRYEPVIEDTNRLFQPTKESLSGICK